MQLLLALLHELVKFAGLVLLAQGLVFALSFGRHESNPIYRFLRFIASPVTRIARRITPSVVVDRHVPLVAFMLLFWIWVALIFVRRALILQGA